MEGELLENRYRLTEKTFTGKSWSSFRARDTVLGTEVEVDILSAEAESLPVSRERMREILQASLRVRGPHASPLFAWGEEEEYFYMVREAASGSSLAEILGHTGSLPAPQALEVIRAAVEVLSEAYGAGLCYLGLNPGQVLVDAAGDPRLLRVGYGWILEECEPQEAARVSPYRAPETDGSREGSRTSDVFALAVMVGEIFPEGLESEGLRLLLARATDPLPRQRPPSPRLLLEELEAVLVPGGGEVTAAANGRGKAPSPYAADADWDFAEVELPRLERPAGKRSLARINRIILMLAGGVAVWLLFAAVSGFLGGRKDGAGRDPGEVEVSLELPDLQGMTVEEAIETLGAMGLRHATREAPSSLWSKGMVVAQEPEPGAVLAAGDTVLLVISKGTGEAAEPPGESDGGAQSATVQPLPENEQGGPPPVPTSGKPGSTSRIECAREAAPCAVASLSVRSGPAPLYVHMDGSGSTDADGDIVLYRWDCGDGTVLEGKTVQHVYDPPVIPARFLVVLEVFDSRGRVGRSSVTVEVY